MNDKSKPTKPKRIEALTRKFHDELLIYDARKHHAHCLNETAAAVWLECSGDATVAEIAGRVDSVLHANGDDALVRLALLKLRKAGLLEKSDAILEGERLLSRRQVLKRIRKTAIVALPIVTTMLVPTPASAASCFPLLHPCSSNGQCCSGHCGVSGLSVVCLP